MSIAEGVLANVVAGACFEATKTEVVCFSAGSVHQAVESSALTIPNACRSGHVTC
jgi:hypothetical protein